MAESQCIGLYPTRLVISDSELKPEFGKKLIHPVLTKIWRSNFAHVRMTDFVGTQAVPHLGCRNVWKTSEL